MKQNIREHFGRRQTWVMFFMILFTCMTLCVDAMAKPNKNTKNLNREAAEAFENGDYDTALAKFNESYTLKPRPGLLYNMGRACQAKADHQCAINYYTQFIASPDVDQENLEDALGRIESLKKVIELTGGKPAAYVPPVAAAPVQAGNDAPLATPSGKKRVSKKGKSGKPEVDGCVNINTANEYELTALPGVAEATAKKIIDSRASGPFKSPEDIQRVKGIGPGKFSKMKDFICPMNGTAAPAAVAPPVAAPPALPPQGIPAAPKAAGGAVDI